MNVKKKKNENDYPKQKFSDGSEFSMFSLRLRARDKYGNLVWLNK